MEQLRLPEVKGPAQVVQAVCGIWTIRSYRLQSSCGFQSSPGEDSPRQPPSLRVATRLQEEAVGGEKRTEMGRGENTLSKAVCGFQNFMINVDWRGEQIDEVRSLET